MARRRRRRSGRRYGSYVWQSYANAKRHVWEADDDDNYPIIRSDELFQTSMRPGLGDPLDDLGALTHEPFPNDHTLVRMRGSMAHNGEGNVTKEPSWFPLVVACVRVPKGLSIDKEDTYPNLFDNTELGNLDIIYRHDVVCDSSPSNANPNWHDVDNKAARKFEIGDTIKWLYSLRQAFDPSPQNNSWSLTVAVNIRFLWKLKV